MSLEFQISLKAFPLQKQRHPILIINPHLPIRNLINIEPFWSHFLAFPHLSLKFGGLENMHLQSLRFTIIIHLYVSYKSSISRCDTSFFHSFSDGGLINGFTRFVDFSSKSIVFAMSESSLLHSKQQFLILLYQKQG